MAPLPERSREYGTHKTVEARFQGWCRLHGVGSHASGFYAMLVLMSGIDAHGASAADAVPN